MSIGFYEQHTNKQLAQFTCIASGCTDSPTCRSLSSTSPYKSGFICLLRSISPSMAATQASLKHPNALRATSLMKGKKKGKKNSHKEGRHGN